MADWCGGITRVVTRRISSGRLPLPLAKAASAFLQVLMTWYTVTIALPDAFQQGGSDELAKGLRLNTHTADWRTTMATFLLTWNPKHRPWATST